MIVATIADGALARLCEMLADMNTLPSFADPDNSLIPFGQFDRLHTARLVIIDSNTLHEIEAFGVAPRPWRAALAFMGDVDGDASTFIDELAEKAQTGLLEIFSCCEDAPNNEQLSAWMKARNTTPAVNYVNYLGRTVKQIREESALHTSLAHYLQDNIDNLDLDETYQVRQRLLTHIEWEVHEGHLQLSPPDPTPSGWRLNNLAHLIGVPLVMVLLTPAFLLIAPFFLIRLRQLETSDPELFIRPARDQIKTLAAQEDWDVTNQYNVFGDLKPGLFRLWTFRFTLVLINYFARHIYKRGFLSRVRTIHFARWVLMDNNHRVFFASTYDGSHESYMDDFINKVGWGLNLSFSHGVGYPTTNWLIKQGANRESPFKYTQRRHQLGSEVWYKAYPGLTAVDLHRNTRIREGLEIRPASEAAMREWLSLI